MNLTLWIIAGVLSVAYFIGGSAKLIMSKEKYEAHAPWAEDFSAGNIKAFGALEMLAAVGLILPAALDIAPILVPLAALGLVLYMAGATTTRIRRREFKLMMADLGFLSVAGFVAWGRFGPESFTG